MLHTGSHNRYTQVECKLVHQQVHTCPLPGPPSTAVDGGHRAIIFSRITGVQKSVYGEGLHFRIPWFQYPIIYDIRARPKLLTSPTGSKDLQMVNIGLRVLFRPSQSELPEMYRRLGLDYDERVLPSICNEVCSAYSVVCQCVGGCAVTGDILCAGVEGCGCSVQCLPTHNSAWEGERVRNCCVCSCKHTTCSLCRSVI